MQPSEKDECCSRILVITHSDRAPGGNFCLSLQRHGAHLSYIAPFDGAAIPADHVGYDGLVVLGGPQHAGDDVSAPHFKPLMQLLLSFDQAGKPVAGICLGCQLLARAHGGRVTRLGFLEFGFIQHYLTKSGAQDPIIGNQHIPLLMEFHEDSFEMPGSADLLLEGSPLCPNQCFRVGRVSYGFQFHLEVDADTLTDWLALFREGEIETYRKYRKQIGDELLCDLALRSEEYLRDSAIFCDEVAGRWLNIAKKTSKRRFAD